MVHLKFNVKIHCNTKKSHVKLMSAFIGSMVSIIRFWENVNVFQPMRCALFWLFILIGKICFMIVTGVPMVFFYILHSISRHQQFDIVSPWVSKVLFSDRIVVFMHLVLSCRCFIGVYNTFLSVIVPFPLFPLWWFIHSVVVFAYSRVLSI